MDPLTELEREMLLLAATPYKYGGAREAAMRDRWGLSSVAYWVRVNALLDDPRAEAAEPMVVRRLRRLRDARRAVRSARRLV